MDIMDLSSSSSSHHRDVFDVVAADTKKKPTGLPRLKGYIIAMLATQTVVLALCCVFVSTTEKEGGMLYVKSIGQALVVLVDSIAGGVLNGERNGLRLDGWMNVDAAIEGTLETQNLTVFLVTLVVYTLDVICSVISLGDADNDTPDVDPTPPEPVGVVASIIEGISIVLGSSAHGTDDVLADDIEEPTSNWFLEGGGEIILTIFMFIQAIVVIVFDSLCLAKIVSFTRGEGKFWDSVSSSGSNDIYGSGVLANLTKRNKKGGLCSNCNIAAKFGSLGRRGNMLMKEQAFTIRTLQVRHKALSEELMKKTSERGLDKEIAEQYLQGGDGVGGNKNARSPISPSSAAQEARLTSQISNTKHKILVMGDEIVALRKEILELNKANESLALRVESEKLARDIE